MSYCPNSIVVWYTKDGIIDLEVIYPVTFVQVVEEPEQFISAGEALEVAKNKFVNILATQKRTIERWSWCMYTGRMDRVGFYAPCGR